MEGVSKAEFAVLMGVSRQRVSQWLGARQIDGEALIGDGRAARINVATAKAQLDSRLSLSQRLGANGRALLDGPSSIDSDPVTAAIKAERLRQLQHLNAKAAAEADERSGRFVLADDVKQELGRTAGRLIASFEGALPELAEAIAAASGGISERDALHALRGAWRAIRGRLAGAESAAAVALPALVEASP
jgi:hypothetical protein